MSPFQVPYLFDFTKPVVEDLVIFAVAMLIAILVSAEGQAFAATMLGDVRENPKDRMHFNAFMHMSLLGTLNFFVAGFGWAREIDIDATKFKNHPGLRLVFSRLAGPVANLLMANIAASINWILGRYELEDKVFVAIVVVNVAMAVYSLLIIPPLPGSVLLFAFLPETYFFATLKRYLRRLGPFLIVGIFLAARLSGWTGIDSFFAPVLRAVTAGLLKF